MTDQGLEFKLSLALKSVILIRIYWVHILTQNRVRKACPIYHCLTGTQLQENQVQIQTGRRTTPKYLKDSYLFMFPMVTKYTGKCWLHSRRLRSKQKKSAPLSALRQPRSYWQNCITILGLQNSRKLNSSKMCWVLWPKGNLIHSILSAISQWKNMFITI